jgi:NAD-dependent DNA ligase
MTDLLQLVSALTTVRSINRTDATTLLTTFGSLEKILKSTPETLGLCPGLGPQKASRLYKVLHQPFLRDSAVKGKVKSTSKRWRCTGVGYNKWEKFLGILVLSGAWSYFVSDRGEQLYLKVECQSTRKCFIIMYWRCSHINCAFANSQEL